MTFSVVVPEPSQSSSSVALSVPSVSSSKFSSSSTRSAQPTASPPSTAVTTTQLPSPAESQSGLSRAAIGGLVAGLIVLLQIAVLCGFIYWRRRRLRRPKISGPTLLKTGRSVESFNSDGMPFSGLNREPTMKNSMVHRITTHFAGKQDDWARFDPGRRQDSFISTTSDEVSPVSDDERMEEKEREIGPSPLGSNPVRILEMDATASSRPVEVESPVEPAFQRNAFPPRDPTSLQSSQRSHSRRQSVQRAARSLSPISEGTDSPRATLQATPKERQQNKYVTDWSQFGPAELG